MRMSVGRWALLAAAPLVISCEQLAPKDPVVGTWSAQDATFEFTRDGKWLMTPAHPNFLVPNMSGTWSKTEGGSYILITNPLPLGNTATFTANVTGDQLLLDMMGAKVNLHRGAVAAAPVAPPSAPPPAPPPSPPPVSAPAPPAAPTAADLEQAKRTAETAAAAAVTSWTTERFVPSGQMTAKESGSRYRLRPFATNDTPTIAATVAGENIAIDGRVLQSDGYWYRVRLKDGREAYIRSDLVVGH